MFDYNPSDFKAANRWVKVGFDSQDILTVSTWLNEHTTGRFSLSLESVRFQNHQDAIMFKLSFSHAR